MMGCGRKWAGLVGDGTPNTLPYILCNFICLTGRQLMELHGYYVRLLLSIIFIPKLEMLINRYNFHHPIVKLYAFDVVYI